MALLGAHTRLEYVTEVTQLFHQGVWISSAVRGVPGGALR
jgi:hypothetical protein